MARDPIEDLVHRYADAVVHRDGAAWGATWATDAQWSLGRGRDISGREAIVDFWHNAMTGFTAVVQTCLNGTYDLDEAAGSGTGRWHIQESYQRADGTRGVLLAHYNDRYVSEDGSWKFADRELVVHYSGPPDLSGDFLNSAKPD